MACLRGVRQSRSVLWEAIKNATELGTLGTSAKVSTLMRQKQYTNHVICVYTYDWTDQTDARAVREQLRALGVTEKLHYKADADTYAGKYAHTGHTDIDKYFE